MSRMLPSLSVTAFLLAGTAMADVPNVAVDIAPVHSLVARVMEGVGTPDLILAPGASPHGYSLRPSEAAALQDAEIVVWMGGRLAPWMVGAIETLAGGADILTLLDAPETLVLGSRQNALFEKHGHADAEDDHDDHAGDDHAGEDHAEEDHGPAADRIDPHAWLSPANASRWIDLIAADLAASDPDNADTYFANAAEARVEMAALSAEVNKILEPVRGGNFVVFHDAYQYFETDFDFPASGAISLSDATDPGPARITQIQGRVREQGITCVLSEPQFNPGIVAAVLEGTGATTGVSDPLGADLDPGPTLYPQLIRNLAKTLADCL